MKCPNKINKIIIFHQSFSQHKILKYYQKPNEFKNILSQYLDSAVKKLTVIYHLPYRFRHSKIYIFYWQIYGRILYQSLTTHVLREI